MYFRIVLMLLALLNSTQGSLNAQQFSVLQEVERERARPIPLLRRPVEDPPRVCHIPDFRQSCGTHQPCKVRKEHCGDGVSAEFTDSLINPTHQFSHLRVFDGKYSGNRGFDDIRTAQRGGIPYSFITENKADRARLNPQTNQMSLQWIGTVGDKLVRSGKSTPAENDLLRRNMGEGRVIRAVSHVSLPQQTNGRDVLYHDYGVVFSEHPQHRQAETQSYCSTVHPQVMQAATRHERHQTAAQRSNLAALDRTCSLLGSRTVRPSAAEATRFGGQVRRASVAKPTLTSSDKVKALYRKSKSQKKVAEALDPYCSHVLSSARISEFLGNNASDGLRKAISRAVKRYEEAHGTIRK